MTDLRQHPTAPLIVNGIFYPEEGSLQRQMVHRWLEEKTPVPGMGSVLILPHAAWEFSGALSARALYAQSRRQIRRIVLLASCHENMRCKILLPPYCSWNTAQGSVPVDLETLHEVNIKEPDTLFEKEVFEEENSFESIIPLIAMFFPGVPVLPLLCGDHSPLCADRLTRILVENHDPSSDLVIVLTRPVDPGPKELVDRQCSLLYSLLANETRTSLFEAFQKKTISPCALAPLSVVLNGLGSTPSPLHLIEEKETVHKHPLMLQYHRFASLVSRG